ncbi:MAG: AAA family ATPase [Leptolyngbyaceae bacterium]|nr:AAA family ATPase [Leptolyngbyaceae bacterium]
MDDQPEILPGIVLTPQQWQVLQELEVFTKSHEKLHLLTGYAGTGKTTLLQALIMRMREGGDRRSVVLTAHSNKATKVLSKMADRWNLNVDSMTCCKLLGLRPEIDTETGKQIFKPDRDNENLFNRYRLVIVDEASMISEEMWFLLTNAVSDLHQQTQILFVGDIAQLPPIGEIESKVFSQIYNRSDLTNVVRYGGAIGILAESIRNQLHRQVIPPFRTDANPAQTEGVFMVNASGWQNLLLRAFKSQAYQKDADFVRVLAYTNKRVNALNTAIRLAIYGEQAPRFVKNERLIANAPCLENDYVVLQNSAECEVLEAVEGTQGHWNIWFLSVLTDDDRYRTLTVLHEASRFEYERKLQLLAEEKRWREYWELKVLFHDVRYAYSLTIHKAQGSTFENVFVDVRDLHINRKYYERNQLLYVAVTRSSKRLFILQ